MGQAWVWPAYAQTQPCWRPSRIFENKTVTHKLIIIKLSHTNKQPTKQTNKQASKQANTQTNTQANTQTNKQANKQTNKRMNKHCQPNKQASKQAGRQSARQASKQSMLMDTASLKAQCNSCGSAWLCQAAIGAWVGHVATQHITATLWVRLSIGRMGARRCSLKSGRILLCHPVSEDWILLWILFCYQHMGADSKKNLLRLPWMVQPSSTHPAYCPSCHHCQIKWRKQCKREASSVWLLSLRLRLGRGWICFWAILPRGTGEENCSKPKLQHPIWSSWRRNSICKPGHNFAHLVLKGDTQNANDRGVSYEARPWS